ncbi:hypothetical protein Tco_1254500 [Tanacetum coccineum]
MKMRSFLPELPRNYHGLAFPYPCHGVRPMHISATLCSRKYLCHGGGQTCTTSSMKNVHMSSFNGFVPYVRHEVFLRLKWAVEMLWYANRYMLLSDVACLNSVRRDTVSEYSHSDTFVRLQSFYSNLYALRRTKTLIVFDPQRDVANILQQTKILQHAADGYCATSMADVGGISALDEVIEREVLVNGIPLEVSIRKPEAMKLILDNIAYQENRGEGASELQEKDQGTPPPLPTDDKPGKAIAKEGAPRKLAKRQLFPETPTATKKQPTPAAKGSSNWNIACRNRIISPMNKKTTISSPIN